MQSVLEFVRLGLGGLFLEQQVYQQQRESPESLRRGFILVATIGVLVGLATLIGQVGEALVTPASDVMMRTIYEGLTAMPWYQDLLEMQPGFADEFREQFDRIAQIIRLFQGGGVIGGLVSFVLSPLLYLLGWLIFGLLAHVIARALGGSGTLAQTLGCTALAAGVSLLNLVQIVPFAQVAGVGLLSLVANYVAIREAHELAPGPAFWATILGPLLLLVLFAGGLCVFIFIAISAIGAQSGGV